MPEHGQRDRPGAGDLVDTRDLAIDESERAHRVGLPHVDDRILGLVAVERLALAEVVPDLDPLERAVRKVPLGQVAGVERDEARGEARRLRLRLRLDAVGAERHVHEDRRPADESRAPDETRAGHGERRTEAVDVAAPLQHLHGEVLDRVRLRERETAL